MHYKDHFRGKTVFCHCDNPTWSNFWRYFHLNFAHLGLKKLIATHYDPEKPTYKLEYTGGDDVNIEAGVKTDLDRMWIGYTNPKQFLQPDGTLKSFGNILWYTNLDIKKRHEPLTLFRRYADDPGKYPKYDNYDAINVDKMADIPEDYFGIGVPLTYLFAHCPDQFEIIWQGSGNTRACAPPDVLQALNYQKHTEDRGGCGIVSGRRKFSRVFIRRIDVEGN